MEEVEEEEEENGRKGRTDGGREEERRSASEAGGWTGEGSERPCSVCCWVRWRWWWRRLRGVVAGDRVIASQ